MHVILKKYFNGNIFIVFKHSYIIKYWSLWYYKYAQTILLDLYTFLLFLMYLAEKSEISEGLKNLEILENVGNFQKNLKSENLKHFWKNQKFWKYEKPLKFLKTFWKSENQKNQILFSKIEVSTFFFIFHRTKYFENKLVWTLSLLHVLKSFFCDFATFHHHSTPPNDHQMTWQQNRRTTKLIYINIPYFGTILGKILAQFPI